MTKLHKWALRRIAKKVAIQDQIVEFYRIFANVAREEFSEDNRPTFHDYLKRCHGMALELERRFN